MELRFFFFILLHIADDAVALQSFRAADGFQFFQHARRDIVALIIRDALRDVEAARAQFAPMQLVSKILRLTLPPARLDFPSARTVKEHVERACDLTEESAFWRNRRRPSILNPAGIPLLDPLFIWDAEFLALHQQRLMQTCVVMVIQKLRLERVIDNLEVLVIAAVERRPEASPAILMPHMVADIAEHIIRRLAQMMHGVLDPLLPHIVSEALELRMQRRLAANHANDAVESIQ